MQMAMTLKGFSNVKIVTAVYGQQTPNKIKDQIWMVPSNNGF